MKYALIAAALMFASPAQAEVVFVLTSDVIDSNGVGGGVQTGANFIAIDGYSFCCSLYPTTVDWSGGGGTVTATANKLSLSGLSVTNNDQIDPVWFDIGFSVADLYGRPGGFFRMTSSGAFADGGGRFDFWVDDTNEQAIPPNAYSAEGMLARGANVDGFSAGGTFFRTRDITANSFDPTFDPSYPYYPYSMSVEMYIGLAPGGSLTNLDMSIQYITTPEPSTWALVMLGFGVIAFSQMTPRIRRLRRPGARISDVPNPPTM
jgi:hypothetical protein